MRATTSRRAAREAGSTTGPSKGGRPRTGRRRRPARRACARDDRGSISLELVVVFPVVLLIIFGGIQAALYFYARNMALAAAQEGLRSARVENGTAGAGAASAHAFLRRAGSDILTGTSVAPARGPAEARVTVQGQALSLVPGVAGLPVSQTAAGPVERFTSPGAR